MTRSRRVLNATRPMAESLESRVLLSIIPASGIVLNAMQDEVFDAGNVDGTGSVYVAPGVNVTAERIRESDLNVAGTLILDPGSSDQDPSRASDVSSLEIASSGSTFTGVLDVTDNLLYVNFGDNADPSASISAALASGAGASDVSWNGAGIDSSVAQAVNNQLEIGKFSHGLVT